MSYEDAPMNGSDVKKELANPSIHTILLAANLVAVIAGFGSLWGIQSSRIDSGTVAIAALTARVDTIEHRNIEQYQVIVSQMATLQADIKYMSQGIAELKLRK